MSDTASDTSPQAVVLDFLAHGRSDSPQYDQQPIAYAVDEESFRLFELTLTDEAELTIGDQFPIARENQPAGITSITDIDYEELSGGAQSELDYVIEEIVESNEARFVDFFNDAQPITLRLHQLNLLPGIGKKLRNAILDARKRDPFESFADLEERISGLHDPQGVIIDRITEELREDDLKYRIFARRED